MTLEQALRRIKELEAELMALRGVQVVHHYHHAVQQPIFQQTPQPQYAPSYPAYPYTVTCGNRCG